MKKMYALFSLLFIATFAFAQATLPATYSLASGNYSLSSFDSTSPAGTYPPSMIFHYTIQPETVLPKHIYDSSVEGTRIYDCPYNLTSRNRIVALNANGFAFIGTSTAQYNDCSGTVTTADTNRYVGAAVLALNTTGLSTVNVAWKGTVVTLGDNKDTTLRRQYTVRLQYRVGATGTYNDVLSNGAPVECNSIGKVAGQVQALTATLPTACSNQAAVYLRWVYFSIGGSSGSRPEIGVDDIEAGSTILPVHLLSFTAGNSNGAALLSWKTSNEVNLSRFEVERNTGNGGYVAIATVAAKGTGGSTYSVTDKQAVTGTSQYRLKMINTDGSFVYSNVATFTVGAKGSLSIAPNPVADKFVVSHPQAGANASIAIYSYDGRRVASYAVALNAVQTPVNAGALAKGNYLLVFTSGSQRMTIQLSKN